MQETLKNMPKVILHLHLDGSLRPTSVQRWLQKQGVIRTLEDVTSNLRVESDCKDLNEYLQKFDLPTQVLQDAENIKEATYELFEDLSKQNVVYAEVRFAPEKHLEKGLSYDEVVEAAIEGMEQAKTDFGIDGALILCCIRGSDSKAHQKTIDVARRYLNKGVCAIDLAGAEAIFPTQDYGYIFEEASRQGIPYTIHAGEADGPESVKSALDFGAKRIGHGIRSIEDKNLVERLRINEIPLEVCPISNQQTQAVQGEYPFEELYRRGVLLTLNTDNNTVSGTDIVKEYEWILEHTNLTVDDLIQMNLNAARGIFAPIVKKAEVAAKISKFRNKENKEMEK